ncbi:MAG TPA: PHP domain-containing protein [Flavitalea sp.]|nr:PHP domain-containing protein [Flavitalea sp.]
MDNYYIADQFSMLAKLMDIHNENSFKAKSYSVAAFNIEKLPVQLTDVERSKIFSLKGIGESVGKKVIDILDNGHLPALEEYVRKTPPGILEMMNIKGLGPKKIATIWKEMEIETLGELLYACDENRLARFKGFGEKTQESVKQSINFFLKSQGSHLFAHVEQYAWQMHKLLKKKFEGHHIELTGSFRRQLEIIDSIEWITTVTIDKLTDFFTKNEFETIDTEAGRISFKGEEKILLSFTSVPSSLLFGKLFETSSSEAFNLEWAKRFPTKADNEYRSEEEIFTTASVNYIPPFLREKPEIIQKAATETYKDIIQPTDIRGLIHSHSNWSDGSNTIEEMAKGCIKRGLEYLVISDHSKSAFYANGLQEDRIIEQHKYVDELNNKLGPFRIFKSIECDILNDGSLDYSDEVLATFDLVITSIHSNQKMTQEKAMQRLLAAIANPYTNILGHMTGRLLLSRPGYPVDHRTIIEACKQHNVVIELNANPRRLDMDWRFIDYALELGVLISIDPDAHEVSEFDYTRFGVLQAQKAGVTAAQNLSSFGLVEFGKWLKGQRLG